MRKTLLYCILMVLIAATYLSSGGGVNVMVPDNEIAFAGEDFIVTDAVMVTYHSAKFKECLMGVACNGEGYCLCSEDVPEELRE